jgi:hypothetical protein
MSSDAENSGGVARRRVNGPDRIPHVDRSIRYSTLTSRDVAAVVGQVAADDFAGFLEVLPPGRSSVVQLVWTLAEMVAAGDGCAAFMDAIRTDGQAESLPVLDEELAKIRREMGGRDD